jgi:hypothetical protein
MKPKLDKFPPGPPRETWDFSACPQDRRFECIVYTCYALAQKIDPSFADRLAAEWKAKYKGYCPLTPYVQIPETVIRATEPTFDRPKEIIAHSISEEIWQELRVLNTNGKPIILTVGTKTFVVLEMGHGMSPPHLREHLEALAKEHFDPKSLTIRPTGAGSYPRQLQAELNALSAYILLEIEKLPPADATILTAELMGRPLYSSESEWRSGQARGELLVKKTLEGRLTATLVAEQVRKQRGNA